MDFKFSDNVCVWVGLCIWACVSICVPFSSREHSHNVLILQIDIKSHAITAKELNHLFSNLNTILWWGCVGSICLVWTLRVFLTFHSYTQSCNGWGLYTFVLVTMVYLLSALNWKHEWGLVLRESAPTSNAQGPEYPPQNHNTSKTQSQTRNRGIRTYYGSAKPGTAHVYSLLMTVLIQEREEIWEVIDQTQGLEKCYQRLLRTVRKRSL